MAGWSYPDWEGIVYPRPRPQGFDPLVFLSGFVDVIEVNSTFYHPGPKKNADSWIRRLAGVSGFRLTVKLWQRFSHQREPFSQQEVALAREVPDTLLKAGRLGSLLVQFPWSFKNNEDNRKWFLKVADSFKDLPLAVELRHKSWDTPPLRALLKNLDIALAAIDQPQIGAAIGPAAETTAGFAYVRLHGRNYNNWFNNDAGRDERYDYLYPEAELRPWAGRVAEMAGRCREVYVVFNNHYRGQALANAIQLRAMLGQAADVPRPMASADPDLFSITVPDVENRKK